MKDARTYRHAREDVLVALDRVENLLREDRSRRGEDAGPRPVRIGQIVASSRTGTGADGWNLTVLVEELRAQLEEQADRDTVAGRIPQELMARASLVVERTPDGYRILKDRKGDSNLLEPGPEWWFDLEATDEAKASNMVALATDLFTRNVQRDQKVAIRVDHLEALVAVIRRRSTKPGEIRVNVRPEVDAEALGDLASDLAEAVVVRLVDRLPAALSSSGPVGIVPDTDYHRETALSEAVKANPGGAATMIVTAAGLMRDFLEGKDPDPAPDLTELEEALSTYDEAKASNSLEHSQNDPTRDALVAAVRALVGGGAHA